MDALEKDVKSVNIPTIDKSLIETAQNATQKGNHSRATQTYKQLIDKNPNNNTYKVLYAESLRREGKVDEAIFVFDSILKSEPDNLDALEGKGIALMLNGNLDEASAIFTNVMGMDATRWRTVNGAGVTLALKRKVHDAIEYFREALVLSDNNPTVLNNVGMTMAINEDFTGSEKALKLAISKTADGSYERKRTELNLALIHGMAGRMKDAEMILRKHMPEPLVYNNLGLYASLGKNKDLAQKYLNKALTQSPVYYQNASDNLKKIQGK